MRLEDIIVVALQPGIYAKGFLIFNWVVDSVVYILSSELDEDLSCF
jgi:hypothetical protein